MTLTRTRTQYEYTVQSYVGICWCLHLWCKIKFRNICSSERIEDAHYNSQAWPSMQLDEQGWETPESTEVLELWREYCTYFSNYKLKLAWRRGNYEESHSAKVTQRLILISHPSNVMLRDMLSRIKEKGEELVSGVQVEFKHRMGCPQFVQYRPTIRTQFREQKCPFVILGKILHTQTQQYRSVWQCCKVHNNYVHGQHVLGILKQ